MGRAWRADGRRSPCSCRITRSSVRTARLVFRYVPLRGDRAHGQSRRRVSQSRRFSQGGPSIRSRPRACRRRRPAPTSSSSSRRASRGGVTGFPQLASEQAERAAVLFGLGLSLVVVQDREVEHHGRTRPRFPAAAVASPRRSARARDRVRDPPRTARSPLRRHAYRRECVRPQRRDQRHKKCLLTHLD